MKNKVISTMLLGMSATMAMPGATVFAAEDAAPVEPSAVEQTAGSMEEPSAGDVAIPQVEEPTTDVAVPEAPSVDVPSETPAQPEATIPETTVPETTPEASVTPEEDPVAVMYDYANNEDAKAADTPIDFSAKLTEVEFTAEAFGEFAAPLKEYLENGNPSTTSLYNYVMDVVKKGEKIAEGKPAEVVNSVKYHIILAFEKVYAEDAFKVGRDVRREIIAASGDSKDTEFAKCTDIESADKLYKEVGGVILTPVEAIAKAESGTTTPTPQPEVSPEAPTPTPEEVVDLETLVQGITDLQMKVGETIPTPSLVFDTTKVSNVIVDTSAVNVNVAGVYTIVYKITGVDGTTKDVQKQCTVAVDESLMNARKEMCDKIDALDQGKLKEPQFIDAWRKASEEAKAEINKATLSDDMLDIVLEATEKYDAIVAEQHLYVAKQGDIKLFNDYCAKVKYDTEGQKAMADKVIKETIDNINKAKTVDEAQKALNVGTEAIRKISEQDASVIAELKKAARAEISAVRAEIKDSTTITQNVYVSMITKLDACKYAKEIESVVNSAKLAFGDVKTAITGDMNSMVKLFKDLKGIASDSDVTSTIDLIVALGTPKDLKDGEFKVCDICKALTSDVKGFVRYLTGRCGQTIEGTTKAEAYAKYIELTGGKPDTELLTAKNQAKLQIEEALKAVQTDDVEFLKEKDVILKEAIDEIDAAKDKAELEIAIEKSKSKVDEFAKKVEEKNKLNTAKADAKKAVEEILASYASNEEIKAIVAPLAQTAINAIDAATTETEIANLFKEFDENVKKAVEEFEKNKALATAKVDALTKLAEIESKVKVDYITEDMKAIMTNAKAKVNEAKTVDEVTNIFEEAKKNYSDGYVNSMRAVFTMKLDKLLKEEFVFTNNTFAQKAQEEVAKQKDNLGKVKNEEAMANCYKLAREKVEALFKNQQQAEISKLRDDAISALSNMVKNSNIPEANRADAETVLGRYIGQLKGAESIEEIKTIFNQAKQELQKYGADPNQAVPSPQGGGSGTGGGNGSGDGLGGDGTGNGNSANPNGSTGTTLNGGGSTPGASEKGTLETTNNVKTGDENMGIIAAASSAVIGALAVAGLAIRKFLKRDE